MELSWSVPWIDLHTDERFLRTLIEARWGLIETERGVAVMAENETVELVPEVSGHPVLSAAGDPGTSVAMGSPGHMIIQMSELADELRNAARRCNENESRVHYDVNKALYRCVDILQRVVDEHS